MGAATYVQSSFLGGEASKLIQGRYDLQNYRTFLNVCLNAYPIETGGWVRRPGFGFAQTTRGGITGRVLKFDFETAMPYTLEFTDGHLRAFSGRTLSTTNDSAVVSSISTANPAVVTLATAVTWASLDQAYFTLLSTSCPLLQNRVFVLTKVNTTHFSIADAVTLATIDGSTLGVGSLAATATLNRVQDIATAYTGGSWATLRNVQTDTTAFLLVGTVKPYAVTITTQPSSSAYAQFSLAAANFQDGPYLDPVAGGTLATPSATIGNVTLTLSFAVYSATRSYSLGDYVTSVGINYKSLVDANLNNTPASNPTKWSVVAAADAISSNGFQGTDVGRSVRLLDSANHWTWGRITSLSNIISGLLAGSVNIGTMTAGGNLVAAFDGTLSKTQSGSADLVLQTTVQPHSTQDLDAYVGKNYSGAAAQKIGQAVVYPSNDKGIVTGDNNTLPSAFPLLASLTLTLRAKQTAPASASDGTALATLSLPANTTSPLVMVSSDQSTAWNYVWVEILSSWSNLTGTAYLYSFEASAAQVIFYNPPGSTSSNGAVVQIIGAALADTTAISVWRLGVYSDTTGWPTCGTYHEGRLWLSGSVPNRIDSSTSNGIVGGKVTFSPTDTNGNVLASSGISYVFNAPDANPIFWMEPDLQGIICGTKGGEWLVQSPTSGGLTPTNIAARRVTKIGCANIEPRRTEHTIVFVQKFARKIMEYFADVFSGKFTAPHITYTGKHLTSGNISEIAYQQELNPIVWTRLGGGTLIGCTYKRDTLSTSQGPTIAAWHRHTMGSGRTLESMAVGPSTGGTLDALTVISTDSSTGIRHVEVLTDMLDEGSLLSAASYLDDAVTPTSTSTTSVASVGYPYGGLTLYGLWHLNGKTATAWLGGLDCGDFTVASGSITVPYGDGVSAGTASGLFTAAFVASGVTANAVTMFTGTMPMVVGFTYTSDGQMTRPHTREETGARSGPGFGKKRRNHYVIAHLEGTQGISFGTDFSNLDPALFRQANDVGYSVAQQFSGIHRQNIEDQSSFDGMVCWRVTRPYICNLAAIGGAIETQDI